MVNAKKQTKHTKKIPDQLDSNFSDLVQSIRDRYKSQQDIYLLLTVGRKIIYASPDICKILNYPCDELVNTDVFSLIPSADQPLLADWSERLMEKGFAEFSMQSQTFDGHRLWFKTSSLYINQYQLFISLISLNDNKMIYSSYMN